jgi:threonine aldolase
MFCLSKGLGAPIGSMLCGDQDLIRQARVVRKRMGGGMRQVGVVAAAGLYALEHNVERLAEDHSRARRLAEALVENPVFEIDPETVQTNILVAELSDASRTDEILAKFRDGGLLAGAMGPGRIRFVTHLDIDDADLDRAIGIIRKTDLS